MIQLDIRIRSRTKIPTPTHSFVRNSTPTPPNNLRHLTTRPWFPPHNTSEMAVDRVEVVLGGDCPRW